MKSDILLTGLRPGKAQQVYRNRIERFCEMQSDFRSFVLIADCEAASDRDVRPGEMEAAVRQTVRQLLDGGFDATQSVCFLQSQIPQLSELARLLEGPIGRVDRGTALACNVLGTHAACSKVADMLMFRPDVIVAGPRDRTDFEVASTIIRAVGGETFRATEFVQVEEKEESVTEQRFMNATEVAVESLLSIGGRAARIRAEETLERTKERLGLNYAF